MLQFGTLLCFINVIRGTADDPHAIQSGNNEPAGWCDLSPPHPTFRRSAEEYIEWMLTGFQTLELNIMNQHFITRHLLQGGREVNKLKIKRREKC